MSGLLDGLRSFYFSLEDKYYSVLDRIQKKVPVYSVVDPIDKIIPSFVLVLGLVLLLLVGLGLLFFGGLPQGQGNTVPLTITFTDSASAPVSGVVVTLNSLGDVPDSFDKITNDSGVAEFAIPPGDYTVSATADGFDDFAQDVTVNDAKQLQFQLSSKAPPVKSRALIIVDDDGSVLGSLYPVTITLSFACQSGSPPADQTVFKGNVTVLQPSSCIGLAVTITVNGFVSKSQPILGDTTTIQLQSEEDQIIPDTPTKGSVEVIAKDKDSKPVSGVQFKLYKVSTGSDVLSAQTLSDTGGFGILADVLPGKYKLTATKQGYKIYTSAEFQVNAGEKNTINASLELASTSKKFFVKVLSSENQQPVIGATVILFLQANGGKYIEDGTYTTDVNGSVNQAVGDFNSGIQVVVSHSGYVTEIVSNQGVMLADDSTPIPILVDPVEPKGANGNIPNALIADVKIVDLLGFAVNGAETILYTPDMNGVFVGKKKSTVSGIARYENLPAGIYQAKASTTVADGNSVKVTGNENATITLPVTLDNGTALVEVTVKDSFNKPLADVNVGVYNSSNAGLITQSVTNANGIATLSVKTVDLAYVKTTKSTYIPFHSIPFGIIKDNVHKVNAEMSLASSTPVLDVELISIYELSTTGTKTLASALVPGATYEFHFSVKAPTDQNNVRSLVRVNPKTPAGLQATDPASLTGGKAAKGGLLFFNQTNAADEFSPPVSSAVSSTGPGKVMINAIGSSTVSAYEMTSLVTISPNAFPGTDKLELAYQAKSDTTLSALHVENYTIGNPLPPQGDFGFLFFISLTGSNQKTQVSSALPVKIEANKEYTLDYLISNASGVSFPSATMGFSFGSGTVVPASVTLPGFTTNQSVGGSVKVKATVPCTSCSSITATLNLGTAGAGKTPQSYTLNMQVTPEKEITLKATPTFLIPGLTQTVSVVAVDNDGNPLNASNLVQVTGKLKKNDIVIPFTGSPQGVFIASIHQDDALEGELVEIVGMAPGYISDTLNVPISTSGIGNFSQDFTCITFAPASVSYTPPSNGSLKIDTKDCLESVEIYTTGDGPVGLTAKFGNKIIHSPQSVLAMGATDSKTITLSSPTPIGSFGLYPVIVYAKYTSQPVSKFVPIKVVDVQVNPIDGSSHCLNLNNAYVVDLTDGSDSAEVVNNCNPLVKDAFLPSVSLDLPGAFARALPSINTPDLQSGSSIPFSWQVAVNYNYSNSNKVSLDDYPLSIDDAKWHRYMKMSDTFLKTFAEFEGVVPELITDMVVNTAPADNGTAFLEHLGPDYPFYHKNESGEKKSILYSTTLMVQKETKLQQLCIMSENIENVIVRLDGETIHNGPIGSCDNLDAASKNITLNAGPHQLNIYTFDTGTQHYWIRARTQIAGNTTKLSAAFDMSPLYGSPFVPENTFSGTLYYPLAGPKSDTFSLANKGAPVKLSDGTITNSDGNPIRNILTNATGSEQLMQARIQTYSSDPRIRVFVKDASVYAQYVGFDDPSLSQNIVFENTGIQDTHYAVLSLSDYTAVNPSTKNLTVGVLLDGSSSVLLNEADLGPSGSPVWNGLCSYLNNLQQGIQYYSGATIKFQIFVLNQPASFTGTPCGATVLSVPTPGGFDPATQNANEFWGEGVKKLATDTAFWGTASNKLLIVVTDTKATGSLGDYSQYSDSIDTQLASDAGTILGDNGIRGVVLYKTPIESTAVISGTGVTNKAIESYSLFSSKSISPTAPVSTGFVEALDYSEYILNTMAGFSSLLPFEQAQNNKVVQRLAQFAFPVKEEKIVVKVIAPPLSACVSENGDQGTTGSVNRPKILLNWEWDDQSGVNTFLCDAKTGENASDFAYCDATQFTITLMKKLELLRQALGTSASPEQIAQIPFIKTFDAYLIRDAYTNDFRSDFVSLNTASTFVGAPASFKGGSGSDAAWKDYLSPGPALVLRLNTSAPGSIEPLTLPYSGLYRVQIEYSSPTFFVSGSPSSTITVTFTPLANAKGLSHYSELYDLPFDGAVGLEAASSGSASPYVFGREGYGVGFTGNSNVRISDDTGFAELQSYPIKSGTIPFVSVAVSRITDFVSLNTGPARGVGVEYNKTAGTLIFRAGVPAPALAEWSSSSLGKGEVFYSIHENIPGTTGSYISYNTASGPLAKWVPVASQNTLTTPDCESCNICLDAGNNPYELSTVSDHNPAAGQCSPFNSQLNAGNTFGFTSNTGTANTAYLATTFYVFPGDEELIPEYKLWMSCNPASTGVPKGRIATIDGVASQGQEAQLGIASQDMTKFSATLSMEEILNLISNPSSETAEGWVCSSSKNNVARVYWNNDRLREYMFDLKADTTFGTLSSQNTCEAVGTPLFSGDFWTLTAENQSIVPPTIASKFCPLYNTVPAAGQYAQLGIPYPVGTQVYIPGDGVPITNDPVNPSVQYRFDPIGCSTSGGVNCGPLSPNKVCANNSVLVWKN